MGHLHAGQHPELKHGNVCILYLSMREATMIKSGWVGLLLDSLSMSNIFFHGVIFFWTWSNDSSSWFKIDTSDIVVVDDPVEPFIAGQKILKCPPAKKKLVKSNKSI